MTSADFVQEQIMKLTKDKYDSEEMEDEMDAGRTIGGKKKKVGTYQKKLGRLMKSGLTMKQAHKKLQAAGGSDDLFYAYPEDAEIARIDEEAKLRKMELQNSRDYKKAKQQILERDAKLGQYAKLQREFEDRGRVLKILKSKSIPTAEKEKLAREYYKGMKFEDIPDEPYVPKKISSYEEALKMITDKKEEVKKGEGKKKKK